MACITCVAILCITVVNKSQFVKTSVVIVSLTMLRSAPFEFHTPSSMLIVGPSGSGKTVFTTRSLTDNLNLFATRPDRIHYCYGSWQKSFEKLKKTGVTFRAGIPVKKELDKWFPEEDCSSWTI